MNETNGRRETYLTIEDVAVYLKLAQQTIRKYVLNREIPCHKIKKVIRFRLSEIERWVDEGGGVCREYPVDNREGDLFADVESEQAGADGEAGETTVERKDEEACCPPATDSLEEQA